MSPCRGQLHDRRTPAVLTTVSNKIWREGLAEVDGFLDTVYAQPAFLSQGADRWPNMSDSDIAGDEPADRAGDGDLAVAIPPPRRSRRRVTEGPLRIYIVVGVRGGLWAKVPGAETTADLQESQGPDMVVLGAVLAKSWVLRTVDSQADDQVQLMRREAVRNSAAAASLGFIEHPIVARARLVDQFVVPAESGLAEIAAALQDSMVDLCPGAQQTTARLRFAEAVGQWRSDGALPSVLATLAPRFAERVMSDWSCLHCVQVSGRTPKKRFLLADEPGSKRLRTWSKEQRQEGRTTIPSQVAVVSPGMLVVTPAGRVAGRAHLMLDWLDASSYIKNICLAKPAAAAFAKVLARGGPETAPDMVNRAEFVDKDSLRDARVQADCVAMLLHRSLVRSLDAGGRGLRCNAYLFVDASPQWRGSELWATTCDLHDGEGDILQRRLWPVLALDLQLRDATGKMLALLWQAYLMAGPSLEGMQSFLRKVRSVTSDLGTERKLSDMPFALDLFGELIRHPDAGKIIRNQGDYLFPRAIQMPGWQHLWDNLLQKGLSGMTFFPAWVDRLKALTGFLRLATVRAELKKRFTSVGLLGLAEMVDASTIPGFAKWRWHTLATVCEALNPFLETFCTHFDSSWFANTKDATRLRKVTEACRPEWRKQFAFVRFFSSWLSDIMAWGTGCACHGSHSAGAGTGPSEKCLLKGRRLKEAHRFAEAALTEGLVQANGWTPTTFGCGDEFWRASQGSVRAVCGLAREKLRYLTKIPWLLARLDEPDVRDECVSQWDSAPPSAHHRVSAEFLAPGGPLRAMVDEIRPDGSGLSARLFDEVRSLQLVPMDDSVCESPHAAAEAIKTKSRACSWYWLAATMRLRQNLNDLRQLPSALGTDLNKDWLRFLAGACTGDPDTRKPIDQMASPHTRDKTTCRIKQHPWEKGWGHICLRFGAVVRLRDSPAASCWGVRVFAPWAWEPLAVDPFRVGLHIYRLLLRSSLCWEEVCAMNPSISACSFGA